jgi:phage terminase large subunit-like protein
MTASLAMRLAAAPETTWRPAIEQLDPIDAHRLLYEWRFWARPDQLAPTDDDWVFWLVLAGRGFGKALCVETPIPTPSGWTRLGDVRPGDMVFDESGRQCTVLRTFDVAPDVAYRLHFSDGTYLDACGDHQWVTWTHAERKAFLRSPYENTTRFPAEWPAWRLRRRLGKDGLSRETIDRALKMAARGLSARRIAAEMGICRQALARHIRAGEMVERGPVVHDDAPGPRLRTTQDIVDTLTHGGRGDTNHCIPTCGALDLPAAALPIDPYVLGVWLGDGDSKAAGITSADEEIVGLLQAAGSDVGPGRVDPRSRARRYAIDKRPSARGVGGFVANGSLHSKLRAIGLLRNKHVPDIYLRASAGQRLALLQGLMDTDGSAGAHVEFCSTEPRLADAVVELARSLGQKPVKAESRATLNGRDCGPRWRVTWRPTIDAFRLTRKLAAVRPADGQALRTHHRMIVRAERVDPKPMRCLTVDSPHSMFLAGEGMIPTHNTRTAAEWLREDIESGEARNIAIIGPTASDVRSTMLGGTGAGSGLLDVWPPHQRPVHEPTKRMVTFYNGAVAHTHSAEDPDFRGGNFDRIWCDEFAAWRYLDAIWSNIEMTLRIPGRTPPRVCITTTPRPLKLLRALVDDPLCRVTVGSTFDNAANLAPSFVQRMRAKFGGTRLGQQELYATILDDNPDALFHASHIEEARVSRQPPLRRIVVAIDPAITVSRIADATGIVIAGIGYDEHVYVLGAISGKWSPEQWGAQALKAYEQWAADAVVCERNRGGDLVKSNLRLQPTGRTARIVEVHASRGKATRAEPVAALYEQRRVHHVGMLADLEQEMTEWNPRMPGPSPNMLDALVWGCFDLAALGSDAPSKSDDIDAPRTRGAPSAPRMGEARTFSESIDADGDPFGRWGGGGGGGGRW